MELDKNKSIIDKITIIVEFNGAYTVGVKHFYTHMSHNQ
jgi:hypothetical protein